MKPNFIQRWWLRFGVVLGLIASAVSIPAADSSVIRVSLQNTGLDSDAFGTVISAFRSQRSLFTMDASRLTPGRAYTLAIGDLARATLTAGASGRINVAFATPAGKTRPLLDFDPRGKRVALLDGTNSVLETVLSGEHEPVGITVDERASLENLADAGSATIRYLVPRRGKRQFTVIARQIPGTNWSLYVNGIYRGQLDVRGRRGSAFFEDRPSIANRRVLNFDPRGQTVDILHGTNLYFTGKVEAKINNVNVAVPSQTSAFIPSTGVDADATAQGNLRVDPDARRKFSVEIEDVPAGSYEFLVNNAPQGSVLVVATNGGTAGEIVFSSREDRGEELPLAFDPAVSVFTIRQDNVVFFQGPFRGGTNSGGTNPPVILPVNVEVPLFNLGIETHASATAQYQMDDRGRHSFEVEIEDLPAGTYLLFVGDAQAGPITVTDDSNGTRGKVEFEDDGTGSQLPLTFDPRGQGITIVRAGVTYFQRTFPAAD